MIDFIADNFYYVFLGWLVLNLIQRRYRSRGAKKRTATLYQAILIFIIYIGATIIREESFEVKWIIVPLAVVAAAIYFFRDRILPYKRNCVNCDAKLNMNQIFIYDANLCADCDPDEQEDETSEEDIEEGTEEATAEIEADEAEAKVKAESE
ncbi:MULTISPECIES: hypothetical protein [unclassified Oceanispirochaeta]|uniref:hypothetical protein n=1 Tax=unclassified Oceanispirochaeta TaxID=2635722 RepID=UPI000E0948F0|nr:MULTISPECIES: hypothetical protein [unclassified Oceanispirochaeta]MBF9017480.1 hypothetical protein [Oceanispirochaeta sp. M2]NPD74052.1 hypothetical protein [Oceanispirochaeta sp. M1]RDG30094.1 hypothetical protein DV872_18305 [Oceanispirochaeta sp. M1]